jgi:hypothetical protein
MLKCLHIFCLDVLLVALRKLRSEIVLVLYVAAFLAWIDALAWIKNTQGWCNLARFNTTSSSS